MVTIADVARRAGVSIATVSRVLSPGANPHPVSQTTAARVRAAAQELRFVPSELARGLVARRSGLLGLLVPDLNDPHYPQIASGVETRARQHELAVLICNTLGDPDHLAEYLQFLHARRADAIVLSGGSSLGTAELEIVHRMDVPVVLIGRPVQTVGVVYVGIDNTRAAFAATAHLLDIGRDRVLHLAGPTTQQTMLDRAEGYRQALEARAVAAAVLATNGSAEEGYASMAGYLRANTEHRCDAIFAATDRLAIGAMAAVHDAGLHVPRDVAIMGFDDVPLARFLRPSLSSVAQPADLLGQLAVSMAVDALAGSTVSSVELDAYPIVRGSTQA